MQADQFTHIVVGAGSAGCLVARRVAENRAFNVLLIEAGPDVDASPASASSVPHGVHDARRVPMAGQSAIFDPKIDWNLEVDVPGGGQMIVPQAKVMGRPRQGPGPDHAVFGLFSKQSGPHHGPPRSFAVPRAVPRKCITMLRPSFLGFL